MQENKDGFLLKCVMVIDDTYADRYIAECIISKVAFSEKIILKESAIAALAYLKSVIDRPDEIPQLIFLDINMPEMNGFEFMDAYKELPEAIKKQCIVMMLTTSLNPDDLEKANTHPYVASLINKPLSKEKINQLLESNNTFSDLLSI